MSLLDYERELFAIEKRKNEHVLIAMATQELLNDKKDIGSWGKALMESEGNTDLANSLYFSVGKFAHWWYSGIKVPPKVPLLKLVWVATSCR